MSQQWCVRRWGEGCHRRGWVPGVWGQWGPCVSSHCLSSGLWWRAGFQAQLFSGITRRVLQLLMFGSTLRDLTWLVMEVTTGLGMVKKLLGDSDGNKICVCWQKWTPLVCLLALCLSTFPPCCPLWLSARPKQKTQASDSGCWPGSASNCRTSPEGEKI